MLSSVDLAKLHLRLRRSVAAVSPGLTISQAEHLLSHQYRLG